MIKHTFTKAERLTGKTTIDRLFSTGKSFFCYPFRVVYLLADQEQEIPCRIFINVPKRLHKTAVARNLLKRRVREAYRLGKHDFYLQLGHKKLIIALLYSDRKKLDYKVIEEGVRSAEEKLIKEIG